MDEITIDLRDQVTIRRPLHGPVEELKIKLPAGYIFRHIVQNEPYELELVVVKNR